VLIILISKREYVAEHHMDYFRFRRDWNDRCALPGVIVLDMLEIKLLYFNVSWREVILAVRKIAEFGIIRLSLSPWCVFARPCSIAL
jgi:hypothetical protein